MSSVSADFEERLAAATQALREREVTSQRCSDLGVRQDELEAELAARLTASAAEARISAIEAERQGLLTG